MRYIVRARQKPRWQAATCASGRARARGRCRSPRPGGATVRHAAVDRRGGSSTPRFGRRSICHERMARRGHVGALITATARSQHRDLPRGYNGPAGLFGGAGQERRRRSRALHDGRYWIEPAIRESARSRVHEGEGPARAD